MTMSLPEAVVFDCDGVLLDSNELKSTAFAECLRGYPADSVSAFLNFQRRSFGLSRYNLFDLFFRDYVARLPEVGEKIGLLERFSAYCQEKYPQSQPTTGAEATLQQLRALNIPLFVASGSDEAELNEVLGRIGLRQYFAGVFGSPTPKAENLQRARAAARAEGRIMFVGDAAADWLASVDARCEFYYLSTWAADPGGMAALKAAEGFREIDALPKLLTWL